VGSESEDVPQTVQSTSFDVMNQAGLAEDTSMIVDKEPRW
jgi:hypothetical protein